MLSFLARTRNLMIMACRMCFSDLSLALCCRWDKIPGPGQGWRCCRHLYFSGCLLLKTEEHKDKRGHWMFKFTFKRAWRTFALSMLCTFGAWLSAFLFVKNRRAYDIADVAKLSFLAWTRNLMIMACRMCFSDLLLALCCHWDKIPGLGQGWRRR